jgi:AcrR family transcriptional regulator
MLENAIRAIESGGEVSVRVRDISDASGVSFASLYHFFGSRDGLVEEALAEIYIRPIRESHATLEHAVANCSTAEEFYATIRQIALATYDRSRATARATRLSVLGGIAGRPELARRIGEAQRAADLALATVMRATQERGWVSADLDLATFSAWLTGLTLGRSIIEIEHSVANDTQWNEMSIAAVLHLVKHGPSSDRP